MPELTNSVLSYPIKGDVSSNRLRNCLFLKKVTPCPLIYLECFVVSGLKIWHTKREAEDNKGYG